VDSNEVRRRWADRTGEYSPAYYAYYGPDDRSEAVRELLVEHVGRDAAVLEVGCGPGRHLAHLHDDGFADLAGVELNAAAADVMAEHYPELAAAARFHVGDAEAYATGLEDDAVDATYSVEALQHVHPTAEGTFAELVRVTADLLVTVENETPLSGAADGAEGDAEDGAEGDAEDGAEGGAEDGAGPTVTEVRDDIPLYHRDWGRVFGDLGCEQVHVADHDRTTLRAFRTPDD